MKLFLAAVLLFAFAQTLTTEEKESIVRGDIFQVEYNYGNEYVELKLSGYKLADVNWKDLRVEAYSLENQIQEFKNIQAGVPIKIKRSYLLKQPAELRLRIRYQDKMDELKIPLDDSF